jgi:hypothetical protein
MRARSTSFMERAFGKAKVLDNAVAAEAKLLFNKFGTKSVEESCFRFTVNTGAGGRDYDQTQDDKLPCGGEHHFSRADQARPRRDARDPVAHLVRAGREPRQPVQGPGRRARDL